MSPWDEDSAAVARMREHGAVFLGKTTTPEFGWKGVTDSPLTGLTVNPWDVSKTPGGSSGGAAVAAACGYGRDAHRHGRRRLDSHPGLPSAACSASNRPSAWFRSTHIPRPARYGIRAQSHAPCTTPH